MKCRLLILGLWLVSPALPAQDESNGRELYLLGNADISQPCTACHDGDYFRDPSNRTARSMRELKGWVQGCNAVFPQRWFPEEEDDVAAYLNREYYGFEHP